MLTLLTDKVSRSGANFGDVRFFEAWLGISILPRISVAETKKPCSHYSEWVSQIFEICLQPLQRFGCRWLLPLVSNLRQALHPDRILLPMNLCVSYLIEPRHYAAINGSNNAM
jgi:hypothetical protein